MDNQFTWTRETSILFGALIVGAYVWVFFDAFELGLLLALVCYGASAAVYQALARLYAWRNLSFIAPAEKLVNDARAFVARSRKRA